MVSHIDPLEGAPLAVQKARAHFVQAYAYYLALRPDDKHDARRIRTALERSDEATAAKQWNKAACAFLDAALICLHSTKRWCERGY